VRKLEELAADTPAFEAAWIALGNLHLSRGNRAEAREAYERALQLIDAALTSAEGKIAFPAGLTAAEYADLRGKVTTMRSERDFVQERLKTLGAS
jgi:tetratricopeptide (TPR) repeat protein